MNQKKAKNYLIVVEKWLSKYLSGGDGDVGDDADDGGGVWVCVSVCLSNIPARY